MVLPIAVRNTRTCLRGKPVINVPYPGYADPAVLPVSVPQNGDSPVERGKLAFDNNRSLLYSFTGLRLGLRPPNDAHSGGVDGSALPPQTGTGKADSGLIQPFFIRRRTTIG